MNGSFFLCDHNEWKNHHRKEKKCQVDIQQKFQTHLSLPFFPTMYNAPMKKIFSHWMPGAEELRRAARVALESSLQVRPGERVLIVTNPVEEVAAISFALHDAAAGLGAVPILLFQQPKSQIDFCEEEVVAALETAPEVLISLSADRLGKDRKAIRSPYRVGNRQFDSGFHYLLYGEKKIRAFWSPRVTVAGFVRAVPVDYDRMRRECAGVKDLLDRAFRVRVTSGKGTDLVFDVAGRQAFMDDGNFSFPGAGGNLPAGETFISPVVGTAEGRIVFDGSIITHSGEVLIRRPIEARVRGGFVREISGGEEAEKLEETIRMGEENALLFEKEGKLPSGMGEVYRRNARNIGELGVGLNPEALVTGNMLEDEKAYRTCHFAVGSNYDDDAPALIHLDGLVLEPTVTVITRDRREIPVLVDGGLVLERGVGL